MEQTDGSTSLAFVCPRLCPWAAQVAFVFGRRPSVQRGGPPWCFKDSANELGGRVMATIQVNRELSATMGDAVTLCWTTCPIGALRWGPRQKPHPSSSAFGLGNMGFAACSEPWGMTSFSLDDVALKPLDDVCAPLSSSGFLGPFSLSYHHGLGVRHGSCLFITNPPRRLGKACRERPSARSRKVASRLSKAIRERALKQRENSGQSPPERESLHFGVAAYQRLVQ